MIPVYCAQPWDDYELIDAGGFEKLERFGNMVLIRPEPQAIWDPGMLSAQWQKLANIQFKGRTSTAGDWKMKDPGISDRWNISWKNELITLKLRLGLTAFKHVGLFPEQSVNWDYISKQVHSIRHLNPRFLNLFAYTGAASLAAKAAGADVTHVDSIKQVISWARENQELSGLHDIRWVLEDALKFVKREVKRGKTYHGIILDPPSYGNGPNGEKWKLEEQINEMMMDVCKLLEPSSHFLILNTYSLGFSSLIVENLIKKAYQGNGPIECGELYIQSRSGIKLPLGVIGRLKNF